MQSLYVYMTQENPNPTQIDLSSLLAALEQPLRLVGDDEARARMQAYVDAARPQVERAAFDLLSDAVDAINAASAGQRATLEYARGGLSLRVDEAQEVETEAAYADSDPERVTIRLPRELKALIDTAAARHGMSANNWYVRALARAVARQMRHEQFGRPFGAGPEPNSATGHEEHHGRRRRGFYRGRGGGSRSTDRGNMD